MDTIAINVQHSLPFSTSLAFYEPKIVKFNVSKNVNSNGKCQECLIGYHTFCKVTQSVENQISTIIGLPVGR